MTWLHAYKIQQRRKIEVTDSPKFVAFTDFMLSETNGNEDYLQQVILWICTWDPKCESVMGTTEWPCGWTVPSFSFFVCEKNPYWGHLYRSVGTFRFPQSWDWIRKCNWCCFPTDGAPSHFSVQAGHVLNAGFKDQ